jgi:6-pyruvoyltetrahydropterin 2'-reductase
MNERNSEIPVAEQFSSIQGEGRYMGHPSIFLRTAGCNFLCGGYQAAEAYDGTEYEDQTRAMAEKMGEGDANWVCDTIAEWMNGEGREVAELYEEWDENGFLDKIEDGSHIVLTGGEPLLHQDAITSFLDYVEAQGYDPFVEVETNASIYPSEDFRSHVDQYNLSPKLSNSGLKEDLRYNPEIIEQYVEDFTGTQDEANADFKFVVGSTEDWREIESQFLDRFDIPRENTFLMPAGADQEELGLTREDVADLAINNSVKFTERLQIVIWDEATGV